MQGDRPLLKAALWTMLGFMVAVLFAFAYRAWFAAPQTGSDAELDAKARSSS